MTRLEDESFHLVYNYGTTDNNGNVRRSEIWIASDEQLNSYSWMTQNYTYDSLNRLSSVTELQNGSTQSFVQAYSYDRWGNRTINQGSTSTNIPHPNFTVDTNTNRLIAPSGYSFGYDAAGNQNSDGYGDGSNTASYTRAYDAENHMKSSTATYANPYQVVISNYTYDADGHRVKRTIGSTETWQVYGLGGELLAEYAANSATSTPQKEYGYRNGELLITVDAPAIRTNVALAANGGTATAQNYTQDSTYPGMHFQPVLAIDGVRHTSADGASYWRTSMDCRVGCR